MSIICSYIHISFEYTTMARQAKMRPKPKNALVSLANLVTLNELYPSLITGGMLI